MELPVGGGRRDAVGEQVVGVVEIEAARPSAAEALPLGRARTANPTGPGSRSSYGTLHRGDAADPSRHRGVQGEDPQGTRERRSRWPAVRSRPRLLGDPIADLVRNAVRLRAASGLGLLPGRRHREASSTEAPRPRGAGNLAYLLTTSRVGERSRMRITAWALPAPRLAADHDLLSLGLPPRGRLDEPIVGPRHQDARGAVGRERGGAGAGARAARRPSPGGRPPPPRCPPRTCGSTASRRARRDRPAPSRASPLLR